MMKRSEVAIFGGGCFWCTEALFKSLRGVGSVVSGYAGGHMSDPSYYDVSEGNSGHAEVVRIEFDSTIITYRELLDVFFHIHNPTTINKQGSDVGTQYRSLILYMTPDQKTQAESCREALMRSGEYENPIVTEIAPFTVFYPAEEYHTNYYENNSGAPYCELIISPKLKKLRERFTDKLKQEGNAK